MTDIDHLDHAIVRLQRLQAYHCDRLTKYALTDPRRAERHYVENVLALRALMDARSLRNSLWHLITARPGPA